MKFWFVSIVFGSFWLALVVSGLFDSFPVLVSLINSMDVSVIFSTYQRKIGCNFRFKDCLKSFQKVYYTTTMYVKTVGKPWGKLSEP